MARRWLSHARVAAATASRTPGTALVKRSLSLGALLAAGGIAAFVLAGTSTGAQAPTTTTTTCVLKPLLRDVTINQGLGSYSLLVYGKETLIRLYLSMPQCAASGNSVQITGGSVAVSSGGVAIGPDAIAPTGPDPIAMAGTPFDSNAYPTISTYTAAPMINSTGDPMFVMTGAYHPSSTAGFTATFAATINYQYKTSSRATPVAGSVAFSMRPTSTTDPTPTQNPISAAFDAKTNPLRVLAVPMGDGKQSLTSQWSSGAETAARSGMSATVSRVNAIRAGVGSLGSAGDEGLQFSINQGLLDLGALGLLVSPATPSPPKFCGTGANFDAVKGKLAQFRQSWNTANTANPNAQAARVMGWIDPAISLGPPSGFACFEAMAAIGSNEAWAQAITGRAGQLTALELKHTWGLTPPDRESLFDGAHSQNVTAENPPANRRYNVVRRQFVTTDRSIMKPSATNPSPTDDNVLSEAPDFAYEQCAFGGKQNTECQTYPPGTPGVVTAATLAFVMSGTTNGSAGLSCAGSPTCTGDATGTNVVESYYGPAALTTPPTTTTGYVLRQTNGTTNLDTPVAVRFDNSEHGGNGQTTMSTMGVFSVAYAAAAAATRVEFWKGTPGASGSLLLYARNQNDPPQVTSVSTGGGFVGPNFLKPENTAPMRVGSVRQPGLRQRARSVQHARIFQTLIPLRRTAPIAPVDPLARPGWLQRTLSPFATATVTTLRAEPVLSPDYPASLSAGSSATGTVNFGNSFTNISQVCYDWYFKDDYIDPGESISFSDGSGTFGFTNGFATPRSELTMCFTPATHPAVVANYTDGTQSFTTGNSSASGSFKIGALVVTVTGDAATVGHTVSGSGGNVAQGGNASFPVMVTWAGDTDGSPPTNLTTQNSLPGASTASVSPTTGTPTFDADASVSAAPGAAIGSYVVVVTSRDNSIPQVTRSVVLPVSVTAAGTGEPTFTVNSSADTNDDACTTAPGDCTLREAINAANSTPGTQTIDFNIGSGGLQTITLGSTALPAITAPVVIDGTTQPAGSGAPLPRIELNGSAVTGGSGLVVGAAADRTTIRGLAINRFDDHGFGSAAIVVNADANDVVIEGNYIGTNPAGTSALPNVNGILVNGNSATIGGTTAATRNVISGNTGDPDTTGVALFLFGNSNTVKGNYIGTDANGTAALGNQWGIVVRGANNTIGGTNEVDRNVISGNTGNGDVGRGIQIEQGATGNTVLGNYIGTDKAGGADLGNKGDGIRVSGLVSGPAGPTANNTVGGSAAGSGNVVSGNGGHGIFLIKTTSNTVQGNFVGTNAAGGAAIANGIDGIALDGSSNNTIGGTVSGAGNLSSGNQNQGISIFKVATATDPSGNIVQGNYLGTNAAGMSSIPNGGQGVLISDSSNTTIGGTAAGARNMISGNTGNGIFLINTTSTSIQGNYVGVAANGTSALANSGAGLLVGQIVSCGVECLNVFPANGTTIGGTATGAANTIAYNALQGVIVRAGTGNSIRGNSIVGNGALGIDLQFNDGSNGVTPNDNGDELFAPDVDTGPNDVQNYPVLSGVSNATVAGTLRSTPSTSFTLDFYSNAACDGSNFGEGARYLGSATTSTNASGDASFTAAPPGVVIGEYVTATATNPSGNTSEFSQCRLAMTSASPGTTPVVARAHDEDPANLKFDVVITCLGVDNKSLLDVGATPTSTDATTGTAVLDKTYPKAPCPNATITVNAYDGISTGSSTPTTYQSDPKPPNVSISSPSPDSPQPHDTFLQYSLIPFRGDGADYTGALADTALYWSLTGPNGAITLDSAHDHGRVVDLSAPANGGWATGTYTLTLSATNAAGTAPPTSVTYTVLADNDNDGIAQNVEEGQGSCITSVDGDPTTSPDHDPLNAFADSDNDGYPNGSDPQPCVAATSYQVVADFNPDPLPVPSSGTTVTFDLSVPPGLLVRKFAQIQPSTVRLVQIADTDVSTDPKFRQIAWTVDAKKNTATAKFDRQYLIGWLRSHNLVGKVVSLTIRGSSGAPAWTFEGSDTTVVKPS